MTMRLLTTLGLVSLFAPAGILGAQEKPAGEPVVTYEGDVRPILRNRCGKCHSAERPRGELDLSTLAGILAGGVSGKSVVSGKPEASPLFTLTAHLEDPKMPPNSPKIPQRELDSLRKWIEGGLAERASGPAKVSKVTAAAGGLVTPAKLARPTPVSALAVSPVRPLAVAPGKRQILVIDLATQKPLGALPFAEGEVHAMKFSRDGAVLLAAGGVGGQSGAVVGFDTTSWKRLFTYADETDAILAADISTDKSRVVIGGPSKAVRILSVPDGKVLHTLRKPTDWVLSAGISPEGLLVAAGDRFGGLFVWEAGTGKEFLTLRGHTKSVTGIAWQADSNSFASASQDGTIRVWDMHTGEERAKWVAHSTGVQELTIHPNGKLISAGRDGRVRLWDFTGKALGEITAGTDEILKASLTHDAGAVLSGAWSGEVLLSPLDGGKPTPLALPMDAKPTTNSVVAVAVPVPKYEAAKPAQEAVIVSPSSPADLTRKRETLRSIELAAERLKDEAARSPKNQALAKAYLQLCEAALAMKAEVMAAEAEAGGSRR